MNIKIKSDMNGTINFSFILILKNKVEPNLGIKNINVLNKVVVYDILVNCTCVKRIYNLVNVNVVGISFVRVHWINGCVNTVSILY